MKRIIINIATLFYILSAVNISAAEQYSGFKDYNVLASFVYNLTQNVELPNNKGSTNLCTISGNPVDKVPSILKKIFNAKKEQDIKVLSYSNIYEVKNIRICDYIYISTSERKDISKIIERTQNLPIVTISNSWDFAKNGGVIGFILEEGVDATLEINLSTAKKNNIVINAQLLKIAQLL